MDNGTIDGRLIYRSAFPEKLGRILRYLRQRYVLYLFLLPAVAYVFIFSYMPMYGVQIAFKNFRAIDGIWGSPWVGFTHFNRFFNSPDFMRILLNTLGISLSTLAIGFPLPIILAIMINYLKNMRFKKTVQTISYAPFFISTVVVMGMVSLLLSPNFGIINSFRRSLGLDPIFFIAQPNLFKPLYVIIDIWRHVGWGSIIYIAALSGVSPELHESAVMDGATKLKRVWHIDLPTIAPTIIILLILRIGQVMNVGFEAAFLLQNPLNIRSGEIIQTYVYKIGLLNSQYGYAAAVGLFNNVINMALLLTANQIARRSSISSLW